MISTKRIMADTLNENMVRIVIREHIGLIGFIASFILVSGLPLFLPVE